MSWYEINKVISLDFSRRGFVQSSREGSHSLLSDNLSPLAPTLIVFPPQSKHGVLCRSPRPVLYFLSERLEKNGNTSINILLVDKLSHELFRNFYDVVWKVFLIIIKCPSFTLNKI